MQTLAVLTSGGDAPGMNAAIRAIAKIAAGRGVHVKGVEDGYEGLIDGRFRPLTVERNGGQLTVSPEVETGANLGGTLLGTARSERFREDAGRAKAATHLAGLAGLIVIGGNGSLTGAHMLAREQKTPIIGIPCSIDNDIGCTSTAIGVDTALNTIVDACDRISDTASAHHRAFIVEVMGRQSGYLGIASAVATGADAVLFREQGRSGDALVEHVASTMRRAFAADKLKRRVLVLKSEGVEMRTDELVKRVEAKLADMNHGIEVRATILGHLVRGGRPTFQDRMVAARFAFGAVDAALAGVTDQMVAIYPTVEGGTATIDPIVSRFSLTRVLEETTALIDGTSVLTRWRVMMMHSIEQTLGT